MYYPDWINWRVSLKDADAGHDELIAWVKDCGLDEDPRIRLVQLPGTVRWYLQILVPVLKGEHVTQELAAGHQASLGEGAVTVITGSVDEGVLQAEGRKLKESLHR